MDGLIKTHQIKVPSIYRQMTLNSLTREYYTPAGGTIPALAWANQKFFAPEQYHVDRLTSEENKKLTKLQSLSHKDLLLAGDIEENPGPQDSPPWKIAYIRHFAAYVRRCLASDILPLSKEAFLVLKNKGFGHVNFIRKFVTRESLKIYRKTIPHLDLMTRRFISNAQKHLESRFTPASLAPVVKPNTEIQDRAARLALLAHVSRPDTLQPFSLPCPRVSRAFGRGPNLIAPQSSKLPGAWTEVPYSPVCAKDCRTHHCPLSSQDPHCLGHCPFHDSSLKEKWYQEGMPSSESIEAIIPPWLFGPLESPEPYLPAWCFIDPAVTITKYPRFTHVKCASNKRHFVFWPDRSIKPLQASYIRIFAKPYSSPLSDDPMDLDYAIRV
jgi:hypothetical protein